MGLFAASPASPSAAGARGLRPAGAQAQGPRAARTGPGADAGFTLIELLVVLLIMAIVLAVAIPIFLGVRTTASDRAIQSDLSTALMSAKAQYAQAGGSFAATSTLEQHLLATTEPNLTFDLATVEPARGTNALSVDTSADGQQLVLVGYSGSGGCWAVEDDEGTTAVAALPGTDTTPGEYYATWSESSARCDDAGLAAAAPAWAHGIAPSTV